MMSRRDLNGGILSVGLAGAAQGGEGRIVRSGEATLHYRVVGRGAPVIFLPSLGRGAEDFGQLAAAVSKAGFRAICPQPRGIGESRGPMQALRLDDLAKDVLAVLDDVSAEPALVVGHAFGNRVARRLASLEPSRVRAVILLAAGGRVRMAPDIEPIFLQCFDLSLPDQVRMKAVGKAFFAPGNDASPWRDGWWPDAARAQLHASEQTPVELWWKAGGRPILVIQGREDILAPPANAQILKAELGAQVSLVEAPNAGHAMLPEQPQLIADTVITYAKSLV
jgi:pimeloyl-ACP methyl ester carboxylesterase